MAFKVGDFFADLKINGDTLTLKTMVNSMADMKLETLGEIAALGTLGLALKNAGQEAMKIASGYTAINKEYGTNITMLQRWQNVARASNVPVDAVAQTFQRMAQLIASPLIGNPNSGFMRAAGLLGIQGANRMSPEQLNEVLRVAVPRYVTNMTPTQGRENAITNAGSLIEALGANRAMMQMYMLPENQFRRRENNAPVLTDKTIQQWTELSENLEVVKYRLFLLGEEILNTALPEILKWTSALIDSEGWIKNRFATASTVASMPWKPSAGPLGGPVEHALASFLVPSQIRKESRELTLQQNNNTTMHIQGGNAQEIADRTKREQERLHQNHLTRAAQTLNTQEAY